MTNDEIALRGKIAGLESSARIYGRAYDSARAESKDLTATRMLRYLRDATDAELVAAVEELGRMTMTEDVLQ